MQLDNENTESIESLYQVLQIAKIQNAPLFIKSACEKIIDHPQFKESSQNDLYLLFDDYLPNLQLVIDTQQYDSSEIYNRIMKVEDFLSIYFKENKEDQEVTPRHRFFIEKVRFLHQLAEKTYQQKKYLEAEKYFSNYVETICYMVKNNMVLYTQDYIKSVKIYNKLNIIIDDLHSNHIDPFSNFSPEQYFQNLSLVWQELLTKYKSPFLKNHVAAIDQELMLLKPAIAVPVTNTQKAEEIEYDEKRITSLLKQAVRHIKSSSEKLLTIWVRKDFAEMIKEKLIALCADVGKEKAAEFIIVSRGRITIMAECCDFFINKYSEQTDSKCSSQRFTYQQLSEKGIIDLCRKRTYSQANNPVSNVNSPPRKQKSLTEKVQEIENQLKQCQISDSLKQENKNATELQTINYTLDKEEDTSQMEFN